MRPFLAVTTGRETEEVTVDLVVAEAAEAAGDDIAVVARAEPPAPRRLRTAIVVGVAVVLVLAVGIGVAVALSGDDDEPTAISTQEDPAPAAADEPVAPSPTDAVAPVVVETPTETAPPPAAVAPAAPPPAAAAPPPIELPSEPQFSASLEPSAVTVGAGAPVTVTLRVRNAGAAGDYVYDDDGCSPAVVPQPDQMCTMIARVLTVDAGGESLVAIDIDTRGATPGAYDVPVGGATLRVTITG